MSFWSEVIATAVLPTWLVNQSVVAATAAVYQGRRPQKVLRADAEVWLEYEGNPPAGRGFQAVPQHTVLIHVHVSPRNAGPAGTGAAQLTSCEAKLQAVVDGLHATATFVSTIATIVHWSASIDAVDVDPEETRWQHGTVRAVCTLAA